MKRFVSYFKFVLRHFILVNEFSETLSSMLRNIKLNVFYLTRFSFIEVHATVNRKINILLATYKCSRRCQYAYKVIILLLMIHFNLLPNKICIVILAARHVF